MGQYHVDVAGCANTCNAGPLKHVTAATSSSNFTAQRAFLENVDFLLDERRQQIRQRHPQEVDGLDGAVDQQPDSHNNNERSRQIPIDLHFHFLLRKPEKVKLLLARLMSN